MIPPHVRSLFWDTNVDDFDHTAFPRYTIERVLEHGDEEDVAWLLREFGDEQIEAVLHDGRRLSPRSATFWGLVLDLRSRDGATLRRDP